MIGVEFYSNAGSQSGGLKVVFGAGVKKIPAYIFTTGDEKSEGKYCKISEVEIADSVRSIGTYAFARCYDLKKVSIGSGLEEIGDRAFGFNTSIDSYVLPESLVSIGSEAFESNENLYSITIPSKVTSIGRGAFKNCTGLKELTINAEELGDASSYSSWSGYDAHPVF